MLPIRAAAGLTFAERVSYQRAIEEVYWRHRIWPKENPYPKPSLDAVMTQAQLEEKVEDYLRKSQALEDYRQRPIDAGELQAEMDRMAQHTRQPEVLHELFEALGNDPFVIAECLARPVLSESYARVADQNRNVSLTSAGNRTLSATVKESLTRYRKCSDGGCTDDTKTEKSTNYSPTDRFNHTAVWTGSEMIVWGGL